MKTKFKDITKNIKRGTHHIRYEYFDSAPWYKYYEELKISKNLLYPEKTLYQVRESTTLTYPDYEIYEYFGSHCTYRDFLEKVHRCAKAFQKIGVKENDRVTICMPNTPEGVMAVYALNMIGAVANMIHPLSIVRQRLNFM